MVKEIICHGGEIALVDNEDHRVLSYHKWHFTGHAQRPYVCTKLNNCEGITRNIYMHNFLVSIAVNVDHIDGNTLNNQKNNLRISTRQENNWNSKKMVAATGGKPCTSIYKGVSKIKDKSQWVVNIKHVPHGQHKSTGKLVRLGPFKTEIEAGMAYNKKIVELRGEFAWINPIPQEINQDVRSEK